MQESKWSYLKPFAEACIVVEPDIQIKQIAERAIQRFRLDLDTEAARKIISKLLNEKEEEVEVAPLKTATISKPTDQISYLKWERPGTYLVLGCWHAPFHNKELTAGVARLIADIEPEGLILNGDFLDCNSLSAHDRGKFTTIPGLSLTEEYERGQLVLDELCEDLPSASLKVYMYGNHEDRYHRFVADMQNAKTPPQSPRKGLDLDTRGFMTIESYGGGYMTLGAHLDILHGIYYNTHCAKTHIDRFRGSVLFAHTHRIQSYIEGHTGGFNIGWGGDSNSPAFGYADRGTKASWQNGFAVVTVDENGDYYVNQVIANNGRFYYNGTKY